MAKQENIGANLMKRRDNSIVRAYCLQFVPRPVLKIVRRNAAGNEMTRTMSFVESACWVKENSLMNEINLKKAEDRAGSSFKGLLAQHFILLD